MPTRLVATPKAAARIAAPRGIEDAALLQAAEAMLRAHGVPARREVMPGKAGTEAWLRVGEGRAAVRYAVEVVRTLTPATLGGVLLRLREIAAAAGVAHGTADWVLRDLKKMGHLVELGRRPGARGRARTRRLERRAALIDLWTQAYPGRLRPGLAPRRFRATKPGWWRGVDFARYGLALGGEAAAERLTHHLKPESVTLYAAGGGERPVHQDHVLLQDPGGEVEILDAFWKFPAPAGLEGIVPPLLVYADLLATGDDRCLEAAKLVHGRYLARPDGQG